MHKIYYLQHTNSYTELIIRINIAIHNLLWTLGVTLNTYMNRDKG